MKYIYLIKLDNSNIYKIGFSKNPKKRKNELQTGNSDSLTIVHEFSSEFPAKLEMALHNRFNLEKKRGEWFELSEKQVNSFISECEKIEKNISFLKKNNNIFIQ